jgi:hypothetical protein
VVGDYLTDVLDALLSLTCSSAIALERLGIADRANNHSLSIREHPIFAEIISCGVGILPAL